MELTDENVRKIIDVCDLLGFSNYSGKLKAVALNYVEARRIFAREVGDFTDGAIEKRYKILKTCFVEYEDAYTTFQKTFSYCLGKIVIKPEDTTGVQK